MLFGQVEGNKIRGVGYAIAAVLCLAGAAGSAQASTVIACDWGGKITSEPQIVREIGADKREIVTTRFGMALSQSAKARATRNDDDCTHEEKEAVNIKLSGAHANLRKGDAILLRYGYIDGGQAQGRYTFDLLNCTTANSDLCTKP
ncbi:hypothetical protein [Schauerella aestuarii]|uniref:hypothetical protein n=1 Tax=Schauerella aestuarii TaxID=2511204 RepID=UPI00136E1E60|nr:hypothetical protein [Achromobacter aestuarii]MYZ41991.1 hypothetical protein [Achromobacter aestuarii]